MRLGRLPQECLQLRESSRRCPLLAFGDWRSVTQSGHWSPACSELATTKPDTRPGFIEALSLERLVPKPLH